MLSITGEKAFDTLRSVRRQTICQTSWLVDAAANRAYQDEAGAKAFGVRESATHEKLVASATKPSSPVLTLLNNLAVKLLLLE